MDPASGAQRVLTSPHSPSLRATSRSPGRGPSEPTGRAARRRTARKKAAAHRTGIAHPVGLRPRDPTPPAKRTSFEEKPDIVKYDPSRRAPPSPLPSIAWDQPPGEPPTKRTASPLPADVIDKTTDRHPSPAKQANAFGKTKKEKGKGKGKAKGGKKGKGKGKGRGLTALRMVKRKITLVPSKDERATFCQP